MQDFSFRVEDTIVDLLPGFLGRDCVEPLHNHKCSFQDSYSLHLLQDSMLYPPNAKIFAHQCRSDEAVLKHAHPLSMQELLLRIAIRRIVSGVLPDT